MSETTVTIEREYSAPAALVWALLGDTGRLGAPLACKNFGPLRSKE